jgi:hypothetical protein
LLEACRLLDLLDRLEREVADTSLTAAGSTGQTVAHPLLGELRGGRTQLAALLAALGVEDEDEPVRVTRRRGKRR